MKNAIQFLHYQLLVYTTQVNSTFRGRWLVSSEVISQVLFTSEQPKKNKMAFVGILSQIKLLFGPLVIQLVWYILKQSFTSMSEKVEDIYLGKYPPLVYTKTVDSVKRARWLARQTPNILCYLPPSNSGKMAARFASVTSEEIIHINFLWCILSHCFSIY